MKLLPSTKRRKKNNRERKGGKDKDGEEPVGLWFLIFFEFYLWIYFYWFNTLAIIFSHHDQTLGNSLVTTVTNSS